MSTVQQGVRHIHQLLVQGGQQAGDEGGVVQQCAGLVKQCSIGVTHAHHLCNCNPGTEQQDPLLWGGAQGLESRGLKVTAGGRAFPQLALSGATM